MYNAKYKHTNTPMAACATLSGDMDLSGKDRRRGSTNPQHRSSSRADGGAGDADGGAGGGASAAERRFAYSLLDKLLEYLDAASINMQMTRPSTRFSRRRSYSTATEDVKFFGKVSCIRVNLRK